MSSVNIALRKGLKRRPSHSLEDVDCMDDCMAAMVLMSLSCSPKSNFIPYRGVYSVSVKSIDSGVEFGSAASRSITPSPPTITEEPDSISTASPITIEINKTNNETNNTDGSEKIIISHVLDNSNSNHTSVDNSNLVNGLTIIKDDEGIDMDETIDFIIDDPIQTSAEKARRTIFKCTWRGCGYRCDLVEAIEKHVRTVHLERSEDTCEDENDHEEEFYYAEIDEDMEVENLVLSKDSSSYSSDSSLAHLPSITSSPESPNSTNFNFSPTSLGSTSLLFFAPSPTWSHLDMARPPHEDPEYQKQQKQLQQNLQVQNHVHQNHHQQQQVTLPSVTQTIISAQLEPKPERKTVISSPINIPGISVAHRWSTKVRDSSSSSSSSSLSTSCNSSYSLSNYRHHHHHHHFNHHHHLNHHHHHNNNQSQASLLASSSSPINLFSPKAPSKVMRLSSNTSSPVNIKSSANPSITGVSSAHSLATNTAIVNLTTNSVNNNTNSNNSTINSNTSNNLMAINSTHANPTTSASITTSNQWTSLLQSSSNSSSSSSSTSSSITAPSTHYHHHKGSSISPTRRTRTETRKCRKVYGMENRDSWCTQCKWKKACTRFVD